MVFAASDRFFVRVLVNGSKLSYRNRDLKQIIGLPDYGNLI